MANTRASFKILATIAPVLGATLLYPFIPLLGYYFAQKNICESDEEIATKIKHSNKLRNIMIGVYLSQAAILGTLCIPLFKIAARK